jgi:hypothetical protein
MDGYLWKHRNTTLGQNVINDAFDSDKSQQQVHLDNNNIIVNPEHNVEKVSTNSSPNFNPKRYKSYIKPYYSPHAFKFPKRLSTLQKNQSQQLNSTQVVRNASLTTVQSTNTISGTMTNDSTMNGALFGTTNTQNSSLVGSNMIFQCTNNLTSASRSIFTMDSSSTGGTHRDGDDGARRRDRGGGDDVVGDIHGNEPVLINSVTASPMLSPASLAQHKTNASLFERLDSPIGNNSNLGNCGGGGNGGSCSVDLNWKNSHTTASDNNDNNNNNDNDHNSDNIIINENIISPDQLENQLLHDSNHIVGNSSSHLSITSYSVRDSMFSPLGSMEST